MITLFAGSLSAETVRLVCKTNLSEHDPSVKEQYDVTVDTGKQYNIKDT